MLDQEGKLIPEAKKFLKGEQIQFIDDLRMRSSMQGFSDKVKVAKYQSAMQMMAANRIEESVKSLNVTIDKLDRAIKNADRSSGKLTSAIKNITFWGTIIALGSMLIAALSVGLDYWRYFHQLS